LYDGEIFNADAQIGQLLDDVKALGIEERTIIVFYSDHGDMFGKHGRFMRGGPLRGTFYDDVLRIPVVMHHPRMPHRNIDGLAQFIDLAPTLLEWLGCGIPPSFRGKSLHPLIAGNARVNEQVFAGSAFTPSDTNPLFQHQSVAYSVRNERWKLICERLQLSVGVQEQFELYDLKRDPQELVDVSRQNPAELATLKKALLAWLDTIKADKFKPNW
jgi:arylsulfatase A-like enzyme